MSDRDTTPTAEAVTLPFDRSLGYQVRDLNRAIQRALQLRIQPAGATLGAWYFLRVLWEEAESLTQRELAQRIGMQEPTAVIALRAMEEAGWILRERNTEDRRKVHVSLTPAGRALRNQLLPKAHEVIGLATQGMTEAEIDTLLALLNRARANLAEAPMPPAAPPGRAAPPRRRRNG